MKNILLSLSFGSLILCMALSQTSCKKSSSNTADSAILMLHLHTNIDSNEVDSLGFLYPDTLGRSISLTTAEFYISNITLTTTSGTTVALTGAYVLKVIGNEEYMVGNIPVGNYTSISYNVGVDPTNNGTAPSSHPTSSPLSPQTPSMWFGNIKQGYIFMNIVGSAQDASGGAVTPISYQIGSNNLYEHVTLPVHTPTYTAVAKQTLTVHIICDYGRLLRTVSKFSATPSTDNTNANSTLAQTIAAGIPNMFYYEE